MFDVSFSELLLIGVIALIVIGPERLPKVARTLGHLVGRAQRYVSDVKTDIQREIELDGLTDLKGQMEEAAKSVKSSMQDASDSLRKPLDDAQQALKEASASVDTLVKDARAETSATTGAPDAAAAVEFTPEPLAEPPADPEPAAPAKKTDTETPT
jgi:sec-independent protein translocase protein TatB